MPNTFTTSADYAAWLGEVKSRIQSARISAARAVNRDLILLYWDIGRGIVEKQEQLGWGKSVVDRLAADLKREFSGLTGFSARNLWEMRRLYEAYSSAKFLAQAVRELERNQDLIILQQPVAENPLQALSELVAAVPWGHHVNHLSKIDDPSERLYYLLATARFGWTRNVLLNQIKAGAYEHSLADGKTHNFPRSCPNIWPNRPRKPSRVPTASNFWEFHARQKNARSSSGWSNRYRLSSWSWAMASAS